MINIVLFEPEIPPNTGNIIRLAANSGASLHLIEPLGFSLDEKRLRRAGLDYHDYAGIESYSNWPEFRAKHQGSRLWGVSTKGSMPYHRASYTAGDFFLFGPESRGLPDAIRQELGPERLLRIPMRPNSRSLNLANACAIVLYEAWRQLEFVGGT